MKTPSETSIGRPLVDHGPSNTITVTVLWSYVILLGIFAGIAASSKFDEANKVWSELTRTGFTTLGSALTLILGYYFGQKQIAKEAEQEKVRAVDAIKTIEEAKVQRLFDLLEAGAAQSQPDDRSKAQLPEGRPGRKVS